MIVGKQNSVNPLLIGQEEHYYDLELPSKGIAYKVDGNLSKIFEEGAIENGIVKLRALTTKDELIWTDKKLVEDLRAPLVVLRNIVKGLKKPELLCRIDIENLLIYSRILTYGNYTNATWFCSNCEAKNELKVDYTKLPTKKLEDMDELKTTYDKYTIYMTPLVYKEAVEIQKANNNEISEQLDKIISCIQIVIVELPDGTSQEVKDKALIAEWVEKLNPKFFKIVVDLFTKVNNLGTVIDLDVTCRNCGHKETTDVVIDVTNFFSEED